MSLAWRILLLVLLLNVVTVGSVQVVMHLAWQRWFEGQRGSIMDAVQESFAELGRVYTPSTARAAAADTEVVRRLLRSRDTGRLYHDFIFTSGTTDYEIVYLNLLGALHRDPDTFPQPLIAAGIRQAREVPGLLPVADGYCSALRQQGNEVGYLWFQPKFRSSLPTALPLWTSVLGVLASMSVFGGLVFWITARTIRRPLQQLGEAAAAVGAGRYETSLEGQRVPELAPLVTAFERMAQQVKDHTGTLEAAVKQAVEETKQKERALVLSSRLASIGTLAAGVAHEINNPIGGMQNAVNRLLQAPDLPAKQRTYLQLVQDGLQRVARTARRLLDFSPRQVAPGSFALAVAVDGARALVEHRLQRASVAFVATLPPELPALHGDVHEIQQVMLNLFLNSLDAMEGRSGGRITVQAAVDGQRLRIDVDDDGPGMPTADLGRVFDPFFSQKDRPDASGLGLFICYSIVQNHGGEITVHSEPGHGFHVRMWLPTATRSK
jgi:signal transduction histidine kinase